MQMGQKYESHLLAINQRRRMSTNLLGRSHNSVQTVPWNSMQQRNREELCRINFYLLEMGGVLTSAGGSAWTMQASCASLPSPEWTQPLSTSISGASAQQNWLASQELMWADVRIHNPLALVQRLACPQFGAQGCCSGGLKHSVTSKLTGYTRGNLKCL